MRIPLQTHHPDPNSHPHHKSPDPATPGRGHREPENHRGVRERIGADTSSNNLCTPRAGTRSSGKKLSVHDELDEVFVEDVSVSVLQGGDEELGFLVRHRVTQVGHDLSEFTAEHHLVAFTVEALEHLHQVSMVGNGGSLLELFVDGHEGGEVHARLVQGGVFEDFLHVSGQGVQGERLQ